MGDFGRIFRAQGVIEESDAKSHFHKFFRNQLMKAGRLANVSAAVQKNDMPVCRLIIFDRQYLIVINVPLVRNKRIFKSVAAKMFRISAGPGKYFFCDELYYRHDEPPEALLPIGIVCVVHGIGVPAIIAAGSIHAIIFPIAVPYAIEGRFQSNDLLC